MAAFASIVVTTPRDSTASVASWDTTWGETKRLTCRTHARVCACACVTLAELDLTCDVCVRV